MTAPRFAAGPGRAGYRSGGLTCSAMSGPSNRNTSAHELVLRPPGEVTSAPAEHDARGVLVFDAEDLLHSLQVAQGFQDALAAGNASLQSCLSFLSLCRRRRTPAACWAVASISWLEENPFAATMYGNPGYDDLVPGDSEEGAQAWRAEARHSSPRQVTPGEDLEAAAFKRSGIRASSAAVHQPSSLYGRVASLGCVT